MEENLIIENGQQVTVPEEKLHNLNAIMLATFLGGPLAGGYLLYSNYVVLGEEEGGKAILRWAVLITYILFGSLFLLPEQVVDKLPNFLIPWISAAIAYFIAKKLQGEVLDEHSTQGGAFYSRWRALWVSLLCLIVTVVMILPLIFFLP